MSETVSAIQIILQNIFFQNKSYRWLQHARVLLNNSAIYFCNKLQKEGCNCCRYYGSTTIFLFLTIKTLSELRTYIVHISAGVGPLHLHEKFVQPNSHIQKKACAWSTTRIFVRTLSMRRKIHLLPYIKSIKFSIERFTPSHWVHFKIYFWS